MFSWFMSHLSCDYVVDYMEDYMEDFLTHEFQNREMLEKMLKDLDERIEMQTSSTDCGSTWSDWASRRKKSGNIEGSIGDFRW